MKFLTCFLFVFVIHFCSIAQTLEVTEDEDFELNRDSVFGQLDFTEVTTGLLFDYSAQLLALDRLDGVTLDDTTKMYEMLFGFMYATLYSAAIDTAVQLPHPDIYMDLLADYEQGDPVPLGIMLQQYHVFKEDAVVNNLIDTLNGQLLDVPNRPESPYLLDTTFAASALINESNISSLQFVVPSELVFNNLVSTIAVISIDFDDGLGWQTITLDQAISVNYTTGGGKTIIVKCRLSDGSEWQSHTVFYIPETSSGRGFGDTPDIPAEPIDPTAEHSGAYLDIFLGCEGYVEGDPIVLRKPVLIIEGADPPQFGNKLTWEKMRTLLLTSPDNNPNTTVWEIFSDNEVDLIYLDFQNGNDDMRRNAAAVQDAIRWINDHKAEESVNDLNVIIGVSMGGPVGKWALLDMEAAGEDHQTKKYIAFDAPMQGNNFPLGVQLCSNIFSMPE